MKCQKCSTEFEGNACPACGEEIKEKKKAKKSIYKKWWFWLIIVFVVVPMAAGLLSTDEGMSDSQSTSHSSSVSEKPAVTTSAYNEVSLAQMCRNLDDNALKAVSTYENKKVQFEAQITHIDESGTSIRVKAPGSNDDYTRVNCWIDKEHLDFLMEKKAGDIILIKGKVQSVNSSFGYDIDVDYISNVGE